MDYVIEKFGTDEEREIRDRVCTFREEAI